jgi:hypothetical protein
MFGETEFHVTARQGLDGTISLKVTGVRTYGNRSVSVVQTVEDEKAEAQLASIFKKAIDATKEYLAKQSAKDAATAVYVAGQRDEEI